jgi:hypothetical protein
MTEPDDVLRRLCCGRPGCRCGKAKALGYGQTHCPAHDDGEPTLSINTGRDGKLLMYCFAGCKFTSVIEALRGRAE